MEEHSKTTQEDVPERSQRIAQQDPARTNPVFPDPTTIPELSPRTIPKKHSVNKRLTFNEEVSREASEDEEGARGITTPYRISRRFLLIRLHRSS